MTDFRFPNALLTGSLLVGSAFLWVVPALAQTQKTSELGLGLGATNYKGEVSPQFQWQNSRPAATLFYRYDLTPPITLRGAFMAGSLHAEDANVSGAGGGPAPLPDYRQVKLTGSVLELSGVVEYNFLDYHRREDQGHVHFTPYLFIGLAGYYANTTTKTTNAVLQPAFNRSGSKFGVAIPAGVGVKVALSEHWNVGAEMGARKTFTDKLDHLADQDALYVNAHDQDWYYFTGLNVSYTFYKILCPKPYGRKAKLMD